MWNQKNKQNKTQIQIMRWWYPEERGGLRMGKLGEGDQKAQTSSYKINNSWGLNVQYGDYNQ